MRVIALRFALFCFPALVASAQVITSIAGTDWIFPGQTVQALRAPLGAITALALDAKGNLFVGDPDNHLVFRISVDGSFSAFAGNGAPGFSGDGGPATSASITSPSGLAVDSAGNLYVSDQVNNRIRAISPAGIITTIAGNGVAGFSGDGGPASAAELNGPAGLAFDSAGNLHVADAHGNRVRRITPAGIITTEAGKGISGFSGDGGPALGATLANPYALAFDAAGNLYIADNGNYRVREVTTDGVIHTVAGNGPAGLPVDGGPATASGLCQPFGLALDAAGALYIADTCDHSIRKVGVNGIISTVAGNGTAGFSGDGGSATAGNLNNPWSVAVGPGGTIYIADQGNSRVRKVSGGLIVTPAGNGGFRFAGDGGPAVAATLSNPYRAAIDNSGAIYIADAAAGRIRKIAPNGVVATVAGNGLHSSSGDGGPATNAALGLPSAVALDGAGNMYIADQLNNRVRRVTPDGAISTVAGSGTAVSLSAPSGLAVDESGNVYVSERLANRIRRINTDGTVVTVAGNGNAGFSGDGGPATAASLNGPLGVALDAAGNLYIADSLNYRIRKVTDKGVISTVAGNGSIGASGDGGPAAAASLSLPNDVVADAAGNLYIADTGNNKVRKVAANGMIGTVAGTGLPLFLGDGGPAINATLNAPRGVALDSRGNLLIADTSNSRIRAVLNTSISYQLIPSALTFSTLAGTITPLTQQLNLESSIVGIGFTVSSDATWLAAVPSSGTTPAEIQVTVDPTGLAPAIYNALLSFSIPNASPPTAQVRVTLTVQPNTGPPALALSTTLMTFESTKGGGSETAPIRVFNTGSGLLAFTVSTQTTSGGSWLAVTPLNGRVTASSPGSLTVTATPGPLPPGTYSGTITIDADGSSVSVSVTLSVSAPVATILVSQSALNFTAVSQGGMPLPQSFGILNTGEGPMNWSAKATTVTGGDWLQISATEGTVERPYLDVALVNASINPASLEPGTYYGRIQVAAVAANTPQLMTVVLTVLPAGFTLGPQVFPAGLIFTGVAGGTPGSQDVQVGNPSAVANSFQSGIVGTGFSYLPTNASVQPDQPTTVRVYPDFSKLKPGSIQRGTITLQFSEGTARTISVLTVVAPLTSSATFGLGRQATSCSSSNLLIQWRSPVQNVVATVGQPTTIDVQVVDDCGNLIGPTNPKGATVNAAFSNKDVDVKLTHVGNGVWTGTWRPVNFAGAGQVTITVTAFNTTGLVLQSGQRAVSGTLNNSPTPIVTAGGVVHAASDVAGRPVAPGSLITIYGSNLANAAGLASELPLPQLQNGAQVFFGDTPVPILYTSDGQLNVQVPFSAPVNGLYQISVQRDSLVSVPEKLVIAAAQPGVFTTNQQGSGQGVIFNQDGVTLAQPGTPAKAGDTVVIYCTGLGAVSPPVPEGVAPPTSPLSNTVNQVTATIGGVDASVSFSGLTPGFPGLYQINAVVPTGVSGDAVPVVVRVAGQASPQVTIAVQ